MKRLIAILLSCVVASPAWAGTATLNYSPSGSSPMRQTTDGSSNNLPNVTVWDYSAGANGWSIDSSHGGLVAGEGTAGTPAGGVISVQGVSGGTAQPVILNSTPSLANGNGIVPTQGGSVLSATNGIYSNVLQGNAALSATNGLYSNLLQGNTALSTTNGLYANLLQGNAVLSGTNPLPGNIAQMGGTAINSGCVSNYGTAPSAVACPSMNAFVTNANPNPGPLKLNALSTTVTAIKSSAGTLSMLQCGNTNASEGYVQVFNLPSGSVTLGTTAPTLSIPIAATSTGGFALAQPIAMSGSGISAAATTTATGSSALGTALDCNVAFN